MNPSQTNCEQRRFSRICKEIPVEVSELSYPVSLEPGEKCLCKNIGAGGICFRVSEEYKPKTLLSLKISIPGWQGYKKPFSFIVDISSKRPLTAIGEVAWSRKLSDDTGYDVGIRFVNIYEDDYAALMKYIEIVEKVRGQG
ncbi:MAG: hypothetical protein BWK80_25365 [Desulfobacteraceae bacterium IS3]|nr:MAG: hypothetical protein BWK80_25365 [Desulfobacteraceae bacterium IS3]